MGCPLMYVDGSAGPGWSATAFLTDAISALATLNNIVEARELFAEARNMLGGNGFRGPTTSRR